MMDEAVAPADPEIELVDHSPRWRGSTSGADARPRCSAGRPAAVALSRPPGAQSPAHRPVLGAGQSIVRSGRPAKPSIETDSSRISLRLLVAPPGSAGA